MKQPELPLGGILANNLVLRNGNQLYAEIEPSAGRWYRQLLPNVKRWWYEISEIEVTPSDELGIGVITHAYSKYGSGGSYTMRGCMIKARLAMEKIEAELER